MAAAFASPEDRDKLVGIFQTDHFFDPKHREAWTGVKEMTRRRLAFDFFTLKKLAPKADIPYLRGISQDRPGSPENLDFHVDRMLWDHARLTAIQGPVKALVKAIHDPLSDPERVRALARQVPASFDGYKGRSYLRQGNEVTREMMLDVDVRNEGIQSYNYGIDRLDYYEEPDDAGNAIRRMIPGATPGTITVVTARSGVGKALAVDTPIPTPSGWTTMGGLKVGDEIFDNAGNVCRVRACTKVMRNRKCFEVMFSDGASIVADADHLWLTRTHGERKAGKSRTEEGRERSRQLRGYLSRRANVSATLMRKACERGLVNVHGSVRTTEEIAKTLFTCAGSHNHSIELGHPLHLPEQSLPIDPYVLGAWLGDGHSACARITCADFEILWEVEKAGHTIRPNAGEYLYWIGKLHKLLRLNGLLNNKHIPASYLRGSFEQRLALLQGLMDTDGTCQKNGTSVFCTTKDRLADDFEELIATLGIKSKRRAKYAKLDGRIVGIYWEFAFITSWPVFRLPRKLHRMIKPTWGARRQIIGIVPVDSVPVRCIEVDSPTKLFLAGRQMIPTHNSTICARMALGMARGGRKVLYGAWEMSSPVTLELLACMSAGLQRSRFHLKADQGGLTHEEKIRVEEKAHAISRKIIFLDLPFNRQKGLESRKGGNQRNLDIIHGYISDSGCDVAIFDLWKRCLVETKPEDEELALERQQAMLEECNVHGILAHQQLSKGDSIRADRRPTGEGAKGSSTWFEVADTMLGIHRTGAWRDTDDNVMELIILKQRYGKWPMTIEFEWDGDRGLLVGGKTVPYDGDGGRAQGVDEFFKGREEQKRKGRR